MPIIKLIAAIAENRAIGYKNRLIYRLSNDLKRFKGLTTGHTVVMGRRTFESLPKGALPNRRNIVLSRTAGQPWSGTEVFPSLEEALKACTPEEQVFIIGGESVYREALPIADGLCLTHIEATPEAAYAYFPEIKADEWEETAREHHDADEKNEQPYTFVDYRRKG